MKNSIAFLVKNNIIAALVGSVLTLGCAGRRVGLICPFWMSNPEMFWTSSKARRSSGLDAALWIVSVCFSFGIHGDVGACYSLTLRRAPLLYSPGKKKVPQIERLSGR